MSRFVAVCGAQHRGLGVPGTYDLKPDRKSGRGRSARHGRRRLLREVERVIAVLELDDDTGLPPMHSGSGLAAARVGDPVLAVGPRDVVSGAIDALARPVRVGDTAELDALATDTAIAPGNSGGPLVNARGEVLGVSTTIATPRPGRSSAKRNGYAIPVDVAKSASQAIVQGRG